MSISPLTIACQASKIEPQNTVIFGLTAAKINQIAYGFFAALIAIPVAMLLTMGFVTHVTTPIFLALPLIAAFGFCIWIITNIVDYDASNQLAAFQKDAENAPLKDTIEKHGIQKMVQYGIPHPDQFPAIYGKLSLRKAIELHEQFHSAYIALGLKAKILYPGIDQEKATHLQSKWKALKSKPTDQLCQLDYAKLKDHGLITEETLKAIAEPLKAYQQAKDYYDKDMAQATTGDKKRELTLTHTQYVNGFLVPELVAALNDKKSQRE